MTRLAALPADLDFKESGCKSPEVALEIIGDLSEILGTEPMALVETGHGYQPYWPVWYHDEKHKRTTKELGAFRQVIWPQRSARILAPPLSAGLFASGGGFAGA